MNLQSPAPSIGLVGLGGMGMAIAGRLLAAGHIVHGHRRTDMSTFAALGGNAVTSVAALGRHSDTILLMLPNDEALCDVIEQLAPALRNGQLLLCLSTHSLQAKQDAQARARAKGAILLEGEISGTPSMLSRGEAVLFLAGDTSAMEQMSPIIDIISFRIQKFPVFGDALRMKLIANYLVATHTLAAADALTMARHMGLDVELAAVTLAGSAGGSQMLSLRGAMMAREECPPGDLQGFLRYFELLRDAIGQAAGFAELLDVTQAAFMRTAAEGWGQSDLVAVYQSRRFLPATAEKSQ